MFRLPPPLILLLLFGGPASAAGTEDGAQPTAPDFRTRRDQGIHYLRLKQYMLARHTLEQVATTTGGAEDSKTHLALARLLYAQLVLERAFPEARLALELARTDGQRRRAKRLLAELEGLFAGVTLRQAPEQAGKVEEGFIHLEAPAGLINAKKKQVFLAIREHFKRTRVRLPLTLYLPFGSYTANLAPVNIVRGETAEAVTFLDTGAGHDLTWAWLLGGAAAVAAVTTAAVLLAGGDDEAPQGLVVNAIRLTPTP